MEKDYITIQESNLESAQVICSSISDVNKRNRAVANVLAAKIAAEFFNPEQFYIDTDTGLHNIAKVLDDIDISDIYINGSYVDVRVYFSEDEICVPKVHYDYGITPAVYMFIKLNRDLSGGTVTGFLLPNNILFDNEKDNYYYIKEDSLSSYYDVENHFAKVLDVYEGFNDKIYEYLEGSLNQNDTVQLLRILIASESARRFLINAIKAQTMYNMISVPKQDVEVETEEYAENSDEMQDVGEEISEVQDYSPEQEPAQESIDLTADSNAEALFDALEYTTEVTPSSSSIIEEIDNAQDGETTEESYEDRNEESENQEQIETLFGGDDIPVATDKKGKSNAFVVLVFILIIAAVGYFGYTYGYKWYAENYMQNSEDTITQELVPSAQTYDTTPVNNDKPAVDAMPNETVDKTLEPANTEEGNSVAIPAIEKNLDASVLVSNLKVDWEVPAGYAANSSAKYYLVRLGKIIQLNLKSELLLLSKPPISNKITVELAYNSKIGKFSVVGIKESSGEKSVDDTILQTIKSALSVSSSVNTDVFEKLQGNPIIIIHL